MKMSNLQKIIILVIILVVGVFGYLGNRKNSIFKNSVTKSDPTAVYAFENKGLNTNTAKSSISLDLVLDGGPGKNGIPAITEPKFINITEAKTWLKDDADGIVVTVGETTRFYPFNVIVWHEIVNDSIEGKSLVITFCPLCGSSIVFEAEVNGKIEQFGVSGKLYESNLLMYDKTTESLWSQIIGEAVVGDRVGEKLSVYPSQVMSLKQSSKKYPNLEILSKKTGYSRSYNSSPYGDYNNNTEIYFPISINDTRLPAKEIMYIVSVDNYSIAFQRNALSESDVATVSVGNQKISGKITDGEIEVKDEADKIIPGYTAMWFSWAIHHQEDGIVWKK